jgi:hypothetical protein
MEMTTATANKRRAIGVSLLRGWRDSTPAMDLAVWLFFLAAISSEAVQHILSVGGVAHGTQGSTNL